MNVQNFCRLAVLIIGFAILPTPSQAAYTWPTVTPTDGGNGSGTSQNFGAVVNFDEQAAEKHRQQGGTSQNFGAVVNWGSNDDAVTGMGVIVTVVGGGQSDNVPLVVES